MKEHRALCKALLDPESSLNVLEAMKKDFQDAAKMFLKRMADQRKEKLDRARAEKKPAVSHPKPSCTPVPGIRPSMGAVEYSDEAWNGVFEISAEFRDLDTVNPVFPSKPKRGDAVPLLAGARFTGRGQELIKDGYMFTSFSAYCTHHNAVFMRALHFVFRKLHLLSLSTTSPML